MASHRGQDDRLSPTHLVSSDILSRVTDPRTLGELIRERRLARGLSLGQLATAVGRTAATVRSWERGQHFPAADVIERLAHSLEIEASDIEAFMFQEPPSLTVISDESADDAVASESTSVSAEASVETADGEGDDETVEVGEFTSAPASAAETEASFAAGSADELGVMPRIEAVAPPPVEEAVVEDVDESAADGAVDPDPVAPDRVAPDRVAPDRADEQPFNAELDPPHDLETDSGETFENGDEVPSTDALEPAAIAPADDLDMALIDEPTEAIGPPIEAPEPPAPVHVGVAVRAETLREPELPPFLAPLRALFDPDRKWLYWIRGSLTVVALLVMIVVLGWAAGELFDGLGEVLDTIESTDTVSSGLIPSG